MKIRIALCSLALSLLFTAHAWAGVDKDKLVGSWAGEVTAHFHGQKKPFKVEMTFDKVTVDDDRRPTRDGARQFRAQP